MAGRDHADARFVAYRGDDSVHLNAGNAEYDFDAFIDEDFTRASPPLISTMPIYSSPERTGTRVLLRLTCIGCSGGSFTFYNIKFWGILSKSARDCAAKPPLGRVRYGAETRADFSGGARKTRYFAERGAKPLKIYLM